MRIVIYGSGGVGGYFGVRLAQAGNEVFFIARGNHLKAIKERGLQLKSVKGDFHLFPANATSSIAEVSDIDLLLICTKTWQLKEVAEDVKSHLSTKTLVISLLNGVENQDVLCSVIPKNQVLGGLCKIVSYIERPGVINHVSYEPTIVFGELNNTSTSRAKEIESIFVNAGIKTTLATDIYKEIWTKFLFITTISAIGALTRATLGEMIASSKIKEYMIKTSEEIVAIAKAKNINLPKDIIEKQFKLIENQPYNTTASLQRDIMSGKPSELETQNGTIVKFGKELGISTPINEFIYNCLQPQEKKARGLG